ncbi:MAG: HAD family hydrolase [Lachnospiraceae bacterium]|nr:HAD family hydrolase [Lachnospiraceae bacterium]
MIDSIIFDLDGTLWDSTEIVAKAWNEVIEQDPKVNMHLTAEDLKKLFGRPLPVIASILFTGLSEPEQLDLIDRCCHNEHIALSKECGILFPELEKTLRTLKENYKLFIVSNCEDGYIETFLETTGLGAYFTDFECPGNSGLLKGDNNKLIVERNHLTSPIYVGDTQGDADAAKYAEIPFIFAKYGFGNVENYQYSISKFSDLPQLLSSISI